MAAPISKFLVSEKADINTALSSIDQNAHGVVFVIDDQGRLAGVLTDGDIRRALLRGVGLADPVKSVMTTACISLPHDSKPETVMASLNGKISIIPLLDRAGHPVDYASHYRHHRLPVMEPELSGNELPYIMECIKTNWLSSQGPFVGRFEKEFERATGSEYAVAVCNGTAALHLALLALGIGSGDEVILPDLTFAATANAILYAGATPVMVDVTPDTWTLDPRAAARAITSRTKAIIPVHLYGQVCEMDAILDLARQHGLVVIEDAAEGLGAEYHGRSVGTFGDAAAFSFFGNKLITTGEGGMVVFKNKDAAAQARILLNHGMDPGRRYWHETVGYNYRLTNLQAAVGVAQLERLNTFVERKLSLAKEYSQALHDREGIVVPVVRPNTKNVYWLYSIIIDPEKSEVTRDDLMERLLLNGVETRPVFYPLHQMPPYRRFTNHDNYPHAKWLSRNGLSLPSAVTLKKEDLSYVASTILRVMDVRMISRLLEDSR